MAGNRNRPRLHDYGVCLFYLFFFSQPCTLFCHLHLCKVIQSGAVRNSIKDVYLMLWWCERLYQVQVLNKSLSFYLFLFYTVFYCCFYTVLPFNCTWVTLGTCEGKLKGRKLHWQVRYLWDICVASREGKGWTGTQVDFP